MNRFNVKIVISAFLMAAAVAWLAGHVRYSKPGADELDCWNQLLFVEHFNRTNNAPARELVLKVSSETIQNTSSSSAERRAALHAQIAALKEQSSERAAEQVWSDKLKVFGVQRHQAQARYTRTAIILCAISAVLGLLLFITKPAKTTNL